MKFKCKDLEPGDKPYFTLDQWYKLLSGEEVEVEQVPPRFRKEEKKKTTKETE